MGIGRTCEHPHAEVTGDVAVNPEAFPAMDRTDIHWTPVDMRYVKDNICGSLL